MVSFRAKPIACDKRYQGDSNVWLKRHLAMVLDIWALWEMSPGAYQATTGNLCMQTSPVCSSSPCIVEITLSADGLLLFYTIVYRPVMLSGAGGEHTSHILPVPPVYILFVSGMHWQPSCPPPFLHLGKCSKVKKVSGMELPVNGSHLISLGLCCCRRQVKVMDLGYLEQSCPYQ